ncbi:MAG: response regulator [Ignavibacteria bacterium]|jgi:CheY-like chemotaxis protein
MNQSLLDKIAGKSVLVVDDDQRNMFALVSYLESIDLIIHTSESGFKALEILERVPIDIILMDMMMPEMNGYETIRKIKENLKIKDIPIIAVTAQAMKKDREKCLEAGASEYVPKPVQIPELINKITMLVS